MKKKDANRNYIMATRDSPRLGQGWVSGSKKSKALAKPLGQGLGVQALGPWANTASSNRTMCRAECFSIYLRLRLSGFVQKSVF
jgi:hypothetical protein